MTDMQTTPGAQIPIEALGQRIKAIAVEDNGDQSALITLTFEGLREELVISVSRCCCGNTHLSMEAPE